MADERVRLIIEGDADSVVREARRAKAAVGDLGNQTRTASRHANAFAAVQREQARTLHQLGTATKRAAQGFTALAAGGLAHAIKTGSDFEQQMARVDAVTGANAKQMKRLTDVALDLGAKTKYSAGQAAGAMYEMAAAGFKVGETVDALPGVMALAASSNIELKDAAEISSNALRGFKLDASESGHVADVMASAVNRSSLELTDLQFSMKYIGPIAATTGQSLEEMTAALSLMGNAGIKGEQAGTTLRGGLVRLTKPTKMVNEGLGTLGINIKDLQGPKGLKPLSDCADRRAAHEGHGGSDAQHGARPDLRHRGAVGDGRDRRPGLRQADFAHARLRAVGRRRQEVGEHDERDGRRGVREPQGLDRDRRDQPVSALPQATARRPIGRRGACEP
jgi:hypothetical protein